MKKPYFISVGLLILSLVALLAFPACRPAPQSASETPPTGVVTTTSLLGSIVERVGKEKVEVTVITAPATCPGEDDVKPSQIEATARARLFFMHNWPGEAFVEGLLEAAKNPDLRVEIIELEGNWMTPPIQAQGVERVTAVLSDADPANKDFYQANAGALLEVIQSQGGELKARLPPFPPTLGGQGGGQVNVICMAHQAGFLKWAGFNVVATYPPPADLTPEKVKELVDKGREAAVALVVDNLQSGPEAGVQMAQEIGAVHVTLSNFPGGFEGTETWEKAIKKNVELLLEALGK
ncbi:MAG: zinc ABC transporter substrate-binding protein [Chloroflexi bacterium]|nr:zinc ABC transporter substrate-binding protein [Chloroflexota bacterium]